MPCTQAVRKSRAPAREVRVTQGGFAGNLEQANAHGEGWKRVLGWLEDFVTKSE
jgi:hypothetical protein